MPVRWANVTPMLGGRLDVHDGFEVETVGLETTPPATTDYLKAWQHQRQIHQQVADGQLPPRLLFVQHDPVYTAGRSTTPAERPFDGTPVIDVDRGGKITWHGPGQLVGYPILTLPGRVGALDYVRRLEQAVIDHLTDLGIAAGRVPQRTGVWLPATALRPQRKICAIGVRIARRTTMHGFALNVTNSTDRFTNIVPCGISDAGVTSLADELDAVPSLAQTARGLVPHLTRLLRFEPYQTSPDLPTESMRIAL